MRDLIQFTILCLSGVSIWAFAGKRHRLGFLCGLCGQPFWIFTTLTAGQWGMFLLSLWFTVNHLRGLWNHRRKVALTFDADLVSGRDAELVQRLTIALHDAIRRPMGVIPESAVDFYDQEEAERAEERRRNL